MKGLEKWNNNCFFVVVVKLELKKGVGILFFCYNDKEINCSILYICILYFEI